MFKIMTGGATGLCQPASTRLGALHLGAPVAFTELMDNFELNKIC